MNILKLKYNAKLLLGFLFICILTACQYHVVSPVDHLAQADSIVRRSSYYLANGTEQQFNRYMDSAYHDFPNAGPGDRWKKYSQQANYYLNYKIDVRRARLYADSMRMMIAGNTNYYQEFYARTLFTDGDLFLIEHRYSEAFDSYFRGFLFARQHLDTCLLSQFSNKLGLVKYRQGKYTEAIPYIHQALREHTGCAVNFRYIEQSMLNTLAICFERSGKPDSARYYYQKTLALLSSRPKNKDDGLDAARGVVYGNLGGLYAELKNYGKGEYYLKQSIAINNKPGYEMADAITAELKLIRLYIAVQKFPAAGSLLTQTLHDLERQHTRGRNDYYLRAQWLRLYWQYTDSTGTVEEAYAASKKYYHLQDSVNTIDRGLQAADMGAAFEGIRQQEKLALLASDNNLKKVLLYASIALVVLGVLIIWLVITNLRRYREQNSRLKAAMNDLEQSEAALYQKTHFLEGLLANLPIILYQIGADGIITTARGAGLQAVSGWTNDQLVGVDAFTIAPDMADAFRRARLGEPVRTVNAFTVDGMDFYFDTIVLPDGTRPGGIIGFALDITETKKQADQLARDHIFKDKLIAMISHDLRQPLASIIMASHVLKLSDIGLAKADLENIIINLSDIAAKGIGLLEGLLLWVRIGKENFTYRPQWFVLSDNILEANGIYTYSQQENGITLICKIPDDLGVMAHHQMLLFVNRNLISNATKYSPKGGSIVIDAKTDGDEIIVSVTDEGPGMNPEQLETLFKVQNHLAPADHLRGAGIALSLCLDMITQMNGRIWAESTPGHGSTFFYALPIITV